MTRPHSAMATAAAVAAALVGSCLLLPAPTQQLHLTAAAADESSCVFPLDDREGSVNPMILNPQDKSVMYPQYSSREIEIDNGDEFALFCHSTEKSVNYLELDAALVDSSSTSSKQQNSGDSGNNRTMNNIDYALVRCNGGKFEISGTEVDVLRASCAHRMQPRLTKIFSEDKLCADRGADGRTDDLDGHIHTVEIGWQIHETYSVLITVCIDEKAYGTLWTKHVVQGKTIFNNDHNKRPGFKVDNYNENRFFNFTDNDGLNHIYSINSQVDTVKEILGTDRLPDGTEIIHPGSNVNSWNRGHISPDADFVMDYEQDATYFFVNVAPQFGAFNQKNWLYVEEAVRAKSNHLGSVTEVTGGTFGNLAYPNLDGDMTKLNLHYDPPIAIDIPVPKYYWKVLHDPVSFRAVAFLGLNDIYSSDVTETACPTVCDQLEGWVRFDYNDEGHGHVTCCSLADFAKVVSFAPDYRDVNGNWPGLLV